MAWAWVAVALLASAELPPAVRRAKLRGSSNASGVRRLQSADFVYVSQSKYWSGARTYCRANYHDLASIHSASENAKVNALCPGNCWIGGSDTAQEGTWTWSDGTAWDYQNWHSGEPNNCCGGEDYAHIRSNGRWNDDAHNSYKTFVCSTRTPTPAPTSVSLPPTTTPAPTLEGCSLYVVGPKGASQGNVVAYGNSYPNYELSFTMELASDWGLTGDWRSILHIGDTNGQRLPGIWFHGTENKMVVAQSYSGTPDSCALYVAGPVVASQSNQVATVDSLQNYELTFTMELASDWSITGSWQSVFHIGDTNQARLPGIWFHPSISRLHVAQSYTYCYPGYCQWVTQTTGVTFTSGGTYEIKVIVENSQVTLYVDGVNRGTVSGSATYAATDAAVYVGDPWHNAATKVTLSDIRLSDLALSEFCRGNVAATTTAPVVWYQDGANKDYNGMKASCGEQLCTYDQLCPGGEPYTAPVGGQQAVHDMWAPIIPGPGEGTQNWVQVGTRASGSVISTHSRFKFYSYPHRTAACAGSTPTMLVRPTLTTAGGARPTSFYIRAALRAASRPRA